MRITNQSTHQQYEPVRRAARDCTRTLMRASRALALGLILSSSAIMAGPKWETLGIKVEKKTEEEGRTRLQLIDSAARPFSVLYSGELSDAEADRIVKLRTRLMSWTLGPIRTVSFLLSGPVLEALVVPEKIACGETDLTALLPAGLLFRQSDVLEYNFRLTAQNLFVRIKGSYSGEAELCAKLTAAAANPREYIRQRDPEYILRSMDQLKSRLDAQAAQVDRLRRAVLALHNRSFFGGPRPILEKAVARALALKKENPTMTAQQLSEKLKAEGMELSTGEAELILNVYYGEFK